MSVKKSGPDLTVFEVEFGLLSGSVLAPKLLNIEQPIQSKVGR